MSENNQEIKNETTIISNEIQGTAKSIFSKIAGLGKKKLAIILAVILAVLIIPNLFGGKIDKDIREELEETVYQSTGCGVKDLKIEREIEIPDSPFKEEIEYYISGRFKGDGHTDNNGNYFIYCTVYASDGDVENINGRIVVTSSDKKEFKEVLKSIK